MPYVLFIAGLLLICVPDDAGAIRTIIQSTFGIGMLITGVTLLLEKMD